MDLKKYYEKISKADDTEFEKLFNEYEGSPDFNLDDGGVFYSKSEYCVHFSEDDIREYLKNQKGIDLEYIDNFEAPELKMDEFNYIYCKYEEEIDWYFILENKDNYIEHIKEILDEEENE